MPIKHNGENYFENVNIKDLCHIDGYNYWYLHGYLQDMFSFDKGVMYASTDVLAEHGIIHSNNKFYLDDGIYDVRVLGVLEKCTAFLWIDGKGGQGPYLQRGMVVLNSDADFNEAKEIYLKKPIAY